MPLPLIQVNPKISLIKTLIMRRMKYLRKLDVPLCFFFFAIATSAYFIKRVEDNYME